MAKVKLPTMSIADVRALMANNSISLNKKIAKLKEAGFRAFEIENMIFAYRTQVVNSVQPAEMPAWHALIERLTYGVEIEAVNVSSYMVCDKLNDLNVPCNRENYNHNTSESYKIITDASIRGNMGYEIVSPVLKGANGLSSLKNVCNTLKETGANVNISCGLHVHIGVANLTLQNVKNIYINYYKLEKVIDAFMPVSRRANNNTFCKSLKGIARLCEMVDSCSTISSIADVFSYSRYYNVNACSYARHKTVEFRQHSGTIEFEKIEMWVNFLRKLVAYSKDNRINNEIQTINEIPFINDSEKEYFKRRTKKFSLSAQFAGA